MKANHNCCEPVHRCRRVVYQIKDTIFWKQITTEARSDRLTVVLFIRSKIQFFESKSQHVNVLFHVLWRCLSDQRYNFLKANHNRLERVNARFSLFIRSKIQFFESKSQRTYIEQKKQESCLSDQRYNFLKANHNGYPASPRCGGVVYQIKDTIFWKQITTFRPLALHITCCLSDQRYNFLKANHNYPAE